MVVYSGVLTAVTLGVVPLFLALTFLHLQQVNLNFVKQRRKMLQPRVFWLKL